MSNATLTIEPTTAQPLPALSVTGMIKRSFETSRAHGFHNDDAPEGGFTPTRRLMLTISELIEGFEEIRSGHELAEIYDTYSFTHNGVKFKGLSIDQVIAITGLEPAFVDGCKAKPEGVPYELADAVIRIFDFAGTYDIPLERAILQKMDFNDGREYMHGRKF